MGLSVRYFASRSDMLVYLACSAVALVVFLAVQHPVFRRLDYSGLLSVFVILLVLKIRNRPSLIRWLSGLGATYLFCIAGYLLILGVNRFVFSYRPIGGFGDWVDLLVLVPYLSMAPFYFLLQSMAMLLPNSRSRAADRLSSDTAGGR